MPLYRFFKVTLGPLFWLVKRPKVTGRENLPKSGGAVVVANHTHWFNGALLAVIIPRPLAFGARADYFKITALNWVVSWLFRVFGQLPIRRGNRRRAEAFVDKGAQVARDGRLVGVFFEGGISPDGRLYDAYTGAIRIAMAAEVPIIPLGLKYPRWPWRRVNVVIGTPMEITDMKVKEAAEQVTTVVQRLTGQPRAHCLLRRGRSAP